MEDSTLELPGEIWTHPFVSIQLPKILALAFGHLDIIVTAFIAR